MEARVDLVKKRKRKRERHSIRNSYFFNKILQLTLGNWLKKTFGMSLETPDFFKGIKPPYIVIANHNCFWGPFMNAAYVPDPIHYIVSDSNFRNPLTNLFLSMVGSVPKTKAMTDMEMLKHIVDIIKRNGVIGLYPEGQNSYDGRSLPVPFATAKLLKHLRVPVVMAHKHGAYLGYPRWAKGVRRGKAPLSFSMAFTVEELKTMTAESIYRRLEELLHHDEIEWQKKHMVRFRGKDLAEYLEILLFTCPHCKSIGAMMSGGDEFSCSSCGYGVRLNDRYLFEPLDDPKGRPWDLHFDNLRDWNIWQLAYLKESLKERVDGPENLLEEDEILLHVGYKIEPLRKRGQGRLVLAKDNLVFRETGGGDQVFPLAAIRGLNMHNKEMMEFYYGDTLYNFSSINKRASLYKWYNALNAVRELMGMAV